MKILVELAYPGYLRIYGSTVRELAGRGHRVLLAYDSDKRRDPQADRIEAAEGIELVEPPPRRADRLAGPALSLRLVADYVRYLDPRFAGADTLRRRMERFLPPRFGWLRRLPTLPGPVARGLLRALLSAERRLPVAGNVQSWLAGHAPDCVVVSPVLARGATGAHQTETVRAARALGIPVAVAVMSWDHLTSKGVLKGDPDRVLLWNDMQRREARELHRVPDDRIVVTGAQNFDQWFARNPSRGRADFCAELGLDPGRPIVLYVGSSPNIAPAEREERWLRTWLAGLRGCGDSDLAGAGVLVRPHPGNVEHWRDVDLGDPLTAISPRERPEIPMSEADEAHYYDSLHHSATVVGVNTSAMIEAAIVGRGVHTVSGVDFADTQGGTLHFRLLVADGGGPVRAAASLGEHWRQLGEAIRDPDAARAELDPFVRAFVRPHGLERAPTAILADAVEALGAQSAARS